MDSAQACAAFPDEWNKGYSDGKWRGKVFDPPCTYTSERKLAYYWGFYAGHHSLT